MDRPVPERFPADLKNGCETKKMATEKIRRIRFSQAAAAPAKEAAKQLTVFALTLLCARSIVFGQYAPFAVAAVAAVPYQFLFSAAAGGLFGCLLPSAAVVPAHYAAALLAAAAIRWTLQDLVKLRLHPVFAPLTAFLPLTATAVAILAVNGSGLSTAVMYFSEALIAGCAAYFFRRTAAAVEDGRAPEEWSGQEAACAAVAAGIVLLGLSGLSVSGVSAGRIIAVLAVLYAAHCGGAEGGCIAGVAAGAAFGLSAPGLSYLSGAYALGGLMAGLFSPVGRLAAAAAFALSNGIASLQVGNSTEVTCGLYETAAATILFLVLPARVGAFVGGIFTRAEGDGRTESLRRSVVERLGYAARALESVSDSVEEVSQKLEKTGARDINGVYNKAIAEVCRACGLKLRCWESAYGETMDAFNSLTEPLRAKGRVGRGDFTGQFREKCSRQDELAEAVNRHYAEYLAREAAETRAKQIRSLVTDQFATASELLEDMASELEMVEKYDPVSARKVGEVLRLAGFRPTDVSCRIDRFGRMTVEACAAQDGSPAMERGELLEEIARVCGKEFENPCVTYAGGRCRIRMNEKARYRVRVGCAQHNCRNGKFCGDCWKCFPDGNGRQIAIVCDGMGTGGRAAVDGTMACGIMERLVKAGIGFDAALRVVNSALLAKSGDESLSTMDVATLDLFTGEAELLKAGAPTTVFRREGRAVPADLPGLPVGILNESRFAKTADTLASGDLLVMLSDGALSSGPEWLCALVEAWSGSLPQELAEEIVAQAIARRKDGRDDDITALVLMLSDAAA